MYMPICVAASTRTKCYYKFRKLRYSTAVNSNEETRVPSLDFYIQRFGVYSMNVDSAEMLRLGTNTAS